jgi:hypothetical protein
MNETVTILRKLEAKYLAALDKVRGLLEMEGQSIDIADRPMPMSMPSSMARSIPGRPVRSRVPAPQMSAGEVATMTKGDAARVVLQKAGRALHKDAIFRAMQSGGHPVTAVKAVLVALSADKEKRFKSLGNGEWDLTERHVEQEDAA